MNHCESCIFWQLELDNRYSSVIFPYDPVTHKQETNEEANAEKWGYKVRQCNHPNLLFYQRPDKDGAAVCDGSEFMARLLTGPEFGCTTHTPANPDLCRTDHRAE